MKLLTFMRKVLSRVHRRNGRPSEPNPMATAITPAFDHYTWTPPATTVEAHQTPDICPGNKKATSASPTPSSPPHPPLEDCSICHDPVGLPNPEGVVEKWATLHCGHKFGSNCIQLWLQESVDRDDGSNPTCPICRTIARHACGHLISPQSASILAGFSGIAFHTFSRPEQALEQLPRRRRARRLGRRRESSQPTIVAAPRTVQPVGACQTCAANALYDAQVKKWAEESRDKYPQPSVEAEPQTPHQANSSNNTQRSRRGRSWVTFPTLKRSGTTRHPTSVMTPASGGSGIDNESLIRVSAQPCNPQVFREAHNESQATSAERLYQRRLSV